MRTCLLMLFLLTCSFVWTGCGSSADSTEEQAAAERNNVTSTDDMKASLETIAQTGEMGSAAMGFRETLEEMKKTDATKADKLLADLDKLEASSTPAQTKKIAKEMIGKL